eukprot:3157269-Rhodomonas_salina.3
MQDMLGQYRKSRSKFMAKEHGDRTIRYVSTGHRVGYRMWHSKRVGRSGRGYLIPAHTCQPRAQSGSAMRYVSIRHRVSSA